jgi:hypothetical protein
MPVTELHQAESLSRGSPRPSRRYRLNVLDLVEPEGCHALGQRRTRPCPS